MIRIVLVAGGRLKVLEGFGVVALRPLDQTEGEAIARGVGLLVSAVFLEELAEASGGEGVVLLVVGPAGAGEQERRGLVLWRLRGEGRGESRGQDEGKQPAAGRPGAETTVVGG